MMFGRLGLFSTTLVLLIAPMIAQPTSTRTDQGEIVRVIATGQALLRHPLEQESPESAELVRAMLGGAHVVFTNFEAVVEAEPGMGRHRTALIHNAQPTALRSLRDLGFNLISLSNNHSWDLGDRGILATINEARRNGFQFSGTGRNIAQATAPAFLETTAGTVALVSMASGSIREGAAASPGSPGVNELRVAGGEPNVVDRARILDSIREAADRSDLVIAYHHNHVYDEQDPLTPPAWLRMWARHAIDAGASAYIVHGNPIPQGMEIYRGRAILYGLGNFIFQTRRVVHYADIPLSWRSVVADLEFQDGVLRSARFQPIVLHETLRDERRDLGYHFPAGAPRQAQGEAAAEILDLFTELSSAFGTPFVRQDGYAEWQNPEITP